MSIYKKGCHDLYMYQGDTGNVVIKGIPDVNDYTIYFQVSTLEGEKIFELSKNSNYQDRVVFGFASSLTDNVEPGTYCYAVKLCTKTILGDYTEETLIPNLKCVTATPTTYKNKALFMIYPKQVEGVEQQTGE